MNRLKLWWYTRALSRAHLKWVWTHWQYSHGLVTQAQFNEVGYQVQKLWERVTHLEGKIACDTP